MAHTAQYAPLEISPWEGVMPTEIWCPNCGRRLFEAKRNPPFLVCKNKHLWERWVKDDFKIKLEEM